MASVLGKRLSDGSKAYLVRFRTVDGKERSKQFKRKREADAYVSFVEVDRLNGTLVDPRLGRMTVDEWWCEWWPTVTNLRISTRSRDAQFYRTHVKPEFGDTPLAKLDRTALRNWVAQLGSPSGSGLAPATIHKVVQVLNKCVYSAVEDRLIQNNPVAKLPLPKIERTEMRHLNAEEVWQVADAIDARYRAFVPVAGFCGLRLGEILGLRWGRVDLVRRRIQVSETLVDVESTIHFGPPKTKASVRAVSMHPVRIRSSSSSIASTVGSCTRRATSPTRCTLPAGVRPPSIASWQPVTVSMTGQFTGCELGAPIFQRCRVGRRQHEHGGWTASTTRLRHRPSTLRTVFRINRMLVKLRTTDPLTRPRRTT